MNDATIQTAAGVDVVETILNRILVLRVRRPAPDVLVALGRAIGVELPVTPNTVVGDLPRVLWTGPAEWMLVGDTFDMSAIEAAAETFPILLVDVTGGYFTVELSGPNAADLIAKGCTLDLDQRVFRADCSAMTMLAQVRVLIDRPARDSFRLFVDVSHRHHMLTWLREASIEFQNEV